MGSPYKALADDIRRDILNILSKSETKAGDIAGKFKISKPAISNHLKILKEADLVSEKKYDHQQGSTASPGRQSEPRTCDRA